MESARFSSPPSGVARPSDLVRQDMNYGLALGLAFILALGLTGGLTLTVAYGPAFGLTVGLPIGLELGIVSALVLGLADSPWTRHLVAVWLLARRHLLPARTAHFLVRQSDFVG
jgi:hypothetical protein